MTDDDKKKTACLFLTLPERVTVNNNGGYEYMDKNAKNYFSKFWGYSVVPLDQNAPDLIKYFCSQVSQQKIDNVQVIFDIHGEKDALSLPRGCVLDHELVPLFTKLTARNLDIIMAHCQGSENLRTMFGKKSLNTKIKKFNEMASLINYDKNVSLYYMPKGHDANITFTKNGDIFFISNDVDRAVRKQDDLNDVFTETFYKTKDQKDHEDVLQIVHKDGCWHVPAEKPDEKNMLNGIFKDRPPRCFNINVDENKEVSTELVPYKQPNASALEPIHQKYPKNVTKKHKITYKKLDLNLNKKNKINTTIKK